MKKRPWGKAEEDDPSTLVAYEEFRRYRALNRRYRQQVKHEQRRERILRFGLLAAVALGSSAVVWAFIAYSPPLSSNPSSAAAQARSSAPFRSCDAARAAGAASLVRGQPGYASHLDADGDGIACEWSWRNWFR